MKTKYFLIFMFIIQTLNFAYAVNPNCEIYINNRVSGVNLYVKFYPVSGLYNGNAQGGDSLTEYTVRSKTFVPNDLVLTGVQRRGDTLNINKLKYIVGLDGYALAHNQAYQGYFKIQPDLTGSHYEKWLLLGNDASQNTNLDGLFGYGKYNLEIYKTNDYDSLVQICPTITIDWIDFNFPYNDEVNGGIDLFIYINSVVDISLNEFQWNSNADGELIPIFGEDSPLYPEGNIQVYRQYHSFDTVNNEWLGYNLHNEHPRSFGYSFSDTYFLDYPVDGRNLNSPYTIPTHLNSGQLNGILTLLNDVDINTGTDLTVNKKSYLQLSPGKVINFLTVSGVYANLIVQDSGHLNIGTGSGLIIEAQNKLLLKDKSKMVLMSNSEVRFKAGSFFCNEGARIVGNGAIIFEKGYHQYNCAELADFLFQDSIKIILEDSAVVEIPDSTIFHLSGINSTLILNPYSKIKLGVNSKLLLDSSATLIAKGATFTSLDTSDQWEGIVLQNSGEDSIINCTFTNAKTSLSLINTPGHTFVSRVIKNNVFNIPSGNEGYNGIYGENNFRITIENNTFNMTVDPEKTVGVYLKNNNTTGVESLPEENEPTPHFRMFLINNTFNNGTVSMMLLNYTSAYLSFYVKGNIFNSASKLGILGRNLSGKFRDNIISNSGSLIPMGIHLISSSPDFYNNTITSEVVSLHTIGSSYPNLAPIVTGSDLFWTGGKNILSSLQSDNIQLINKANVYTNLGENKFIIADTSENRDHIYGWVDTSMNKYTSTINCWYPSGNPRIYLKGKDSTESVLTGTGLTSIDCDRVITAIDWDVTYFGNAVYDSVKATDDTTGSNLTEEVQLYTLGQNYISDSLYTEGISSLKDLMDTYIYFDDLPASVYDLYSAYEGLDTDTNQSTRNTLFGNLKDYLDDIIYNVEGYDASFISNAYNITIMCEANMLEYDNAANAYEFIALYHPDPDIRLNASWDYAEIEALMGGGYGGGERQLEITNYKLRIKELKELNEIKRINEIISNDPIMSRMKKIYEKISKDREEKIDRTEKQVNEFSKQSDKANQRSNEVGKESSLKSEQLQKEIQRKAELVKSDKFKNEKARRNIFELKNLSKPELEKRRIEDMLLSAKDVRNTESENDQTISIPLDYKLNQNYPNPFNPVTTLEFQIPKSGLVTLKIYDMLGKEIANIVNDNLNPGTYKYEFIGSNFASGVYFYKLVSGDFTDVKRMVLIK